MSKRKKYEVDFENEVAYIDGEMHYLDEFDKYDETYVGKDLNEGVLEKHFKMQKALNNLADNPHVARVWSSGIKRDSSMSIFNILVNGAVMFDEEGDDIDSIRELMNNADDIIISHPSADAQNEAINGCDIVISFSLYNVWKSNNIDNMRKHSMELLLREKNRKK